MLQVSTFEVNSSQKTGKRPVNSSQKNSHDEFTASRSVHRRLPEQAPSIQLMPPSASTVDLVVRLTTDDIGGASERKTRPHMMGPANGSRLGQ